MLKEKGKVFNNEENFDVGQSSSSAAARTKEGLTEDIGGSCMVFIRRYTLPTLILMP